MIAIKFARPCDVSRGYLRHDLWESGSGDYNSAVKVIDLNGKVAVQILANAQPDPGTRPHCKVFGDLGSKV